VQAVGHRPAHHGPAEDVADAGQVEEAFAGLDVLDVGDPDLVWPGCRELAVDEVGRRSRISRSTRLPEHLTWWSKLSSARILGTP
jgi:hypothetical protein